MVDKQVLTWEKKGAIVYITLNRPEVLNAHNMEMERLLMESLRKFQDDNELFVAVLTGAGGRAFSVGMDLKEYDAVGSEARKAELSRFAELGIWKPIIAAVDGLCVGGGLELAMQCDIRIATTQSSFGLPEPRWNLMANYFGCHNLSRMIPLGEAMYMQLTGNRVPAEEAHRTGLVHSIHADRESLMAEADKIAEAITLCAPLAIQTIKQAVVKGRSLPIDEAYRMGEAMMLALAKTEDGVEGARAFAEKRRPVWKMK